MSWTFDRTDVTFDSMLFTWDGWEPSDGPGAIELDGQISQASSLEGEISTGIEIEGAIKCSCA